MYDSEGACVLISNPKYEDFFYFPSNNCVLNEVFFFHKNELFIICATTLNMEQISCEKNAGVQYELDHKKY